MEFNADARMTRTGIVLLFLLSVGCTPKSGNMQVACMRFNSFYNLTPASWNYGETKKCQMASRSTQLPDKRGDLLICGEDARVGWSMSYLRSDFKSQMYENAHAVPVTFRSSGHSGRSDTWWACENLLKASGVIRRSPYL